MNNKLLVYFISVFFMFSAGVFLGSRTAFNFIHKIPGVLNGLVKMQMDTDAYGVVFLVIGSLVIVIFDLVNQRRR